MYQKKAYNRPAYYLLCTHHQSATSTNPFPRMCALVTYYPDIPTGHQDWICPSSHTASASSSSSSPSSSPPTVLPASTTSTATASSYDMLSLLTIQIHLAGQQKSSLWDDYSSSHPLKKRHRCHLFFYPESEAGFAESISSSSSSSSSYDPISARLAWTRALECLKRGFGWPASTTWASPDVEDLWEEYWRKLQDTPRGQAHTDTNTPFNLTLNGETSTNANTDFNTDTTDYPRPRLSSTSSAPLIKETDLLDLTSQDPPPRITYSPTTTTTTTTQPRNDDNTFFPTGPPSQKMRLLSRTVGVDRVVDELLLTFTHTEEIPWLLPGVPPTGKEVRVLLIMTGSFEGGRMERLGVYWDQAGVLVQVGLLDPMLVPPGFEAVGRNRAGGEGVERLPVVGGEGVEGMLRE